MAGENAGGESSSSAGGAPPPASPPPSQGGGNNAGAGGGAASVPPGGQPAGGAGAPSGPKYLERELTRDGKTVKQRVKEEALWSAHEREGALNRKIEELVKNNQAAEARAAAFEKEREQLKTMSPRELARARGGDAVDLLARELEELMKEEQQNADPRVRAAMAAVRENKELKAQLDGIKTEAQQKEYNALVESHLEKLSAAYVPALKLVKLPKNDVTMRLMAEAQETAQKYGLQLDANGLAQETHKAAAGLVEGLVEGIEDDEELLEMFPKFSRRLHAGLLKRHARMSGANQLQKVQPPKPEDRKQPPAEQNGQKVLRPVDEDKAYFGNRRVLRSGI